MAGSRARRREQRLDPALAATDPWQLLVSGNGMLVDRIDDAPAATENARTQALFAGLARTLQPAPVTPAGNVVHAEIRANGEVQLLTAG